MDTATPTKKKITIGNSDVFFRKLFYESKDLLLIFDFELDKPIDVNQSILDFSGYTKEEFMELSRFDLTPQYSSLNPSVDLHKTYLNAHVQKILNGEILTEVGIFKKKNGSEVYAELEIIPTERKIGEAFIIVNDLTDKFRNKSLYKQSERNFKSIVESTAAGITIIDFDGKHLYVSPNIEKITGYSSTEMLGTLIDQYFEKEQHEKIKDYTRLLLKGEDKMQSFIAKGTHKQGHTVWLQGTGTILKESDGKPYAVQTIFIDVSDKVLLEKELEQTKDKYQQIIESLQGVFMLVDLDGIIDYVSPNYTAILGYTPYEVIGKNGLFIFCDEDAKDIREHSLKLLNGEEESYNSTCRANHKDGSEKWLSGTFSLVRDKEGKPSGYVSVYQDQTNQILTEKELEKTRTKYEHIIENLDGVITITDLDGHNNYVSPKITDVLGYQPNEIIGKPGFELFFESEHKNLAEHAQNLLANKRLKVQHTYKGKHKDGSARWINGVASLIKDKEDNPVGFVTIFFDISQEIDLQQKLISSEDRYRSLFENAIDPILIIDLKLKEVIDCNKAALIFYGLKDKSDLSVISQQYSKVRYQTDKGEDLPTLLKNANKEGRVEYQVQYYDEKHGEVILDCCFTLDKTEKKNHKAVLFLKDVTDQVKAFKKVTRERELLHAVIEGTSDQIIVQDKDRKIIAVNSNFMKSFNESHDIKIGLGTDMKSISTTNEFINFGDKLEWEKKINSVLQGNTIIHQYSRNLNDIVSHFSLSASPLKDQDEVIGIIGAVRDITELVNKTEEIEEKNKELQKYLNSNIQLENFAYIASHDLKQPLRTIISFSELLKSKKSELLDKDATTYLDFILESSQRLNELISDMLAYSVIGTAGKKDAHNPKILIAQVLHDLSAQIEQKNAKITVGILPSSINIFKSEFISLIQNLISNSIKYSRKDVAPLIGISCKEYNSSYTFSVTDNGKGIEARYLNRIFGMFQRLEKDDITTGTGIGLAHCKKIVELHGGKIWVESKPGSGSTFLFEIPK